MVHRHRLPFRSTRLVALAAVVVLVAAGCSSDDATVADTAAPAPTTSSAPEPTAPSTLNVTATDYAYAVDTEEVAAGLVTVNQDNQGAEAHQVTLVRLEDDQTVAEVVAGFQGPEGDHFVGNAAYAGGPTNTLPGEEATTTIELTEGTYGMFCFIASADGESHFVKGMAGQVEVVSGPEEPIEPPEVDATIRMSDFTYDVPADFTGQGVVEVVNDGPQVHELTIATPDLSAGSGLAAIAPGATAYVPLDLRPGPYNFVCFVSDPDSGDPHFTLGMNIDVTVPGEGQLRSGRPPRPASAGRGQ